MGFSAACIAMLSGCGGGNPDSGSARPSIALIAEGSEAIARVCKLDKHLAPRVRFTHRRGREVLAFRLGGRPASISSHPGQLPSHLFLYNFGSGTVSERVSRRPRLLPATLNPLARSGLTACASERTDDTTRELPSPPERCADTLVGSGVGALRALAHPGRDLPRDPVVPTARLAVRCMGARGGRYVRRTRRPRAAAEALGYPRVALLAVGFVIAIAVVTPSRSSNDLWSYTMYGRTVTVHHANPYLQVPADYPSDPFLTRVSPRWRHTGSVYGPLFVGVASVGTLVASDSALASRLYFQVLAGSRARRDSPHRVATDSKPGCHPVARTQSGAGRHSRERRSQRRLRRPRAPCGRAARRTGPRARGQESPSVSRC